MSAKLNQIIAIVNGKKSKTEKELTEIYHKIQKSELFNGIKRIYTKKNEDGDDFPPESKNIQYSVAEAIQSVTTIWTELLDVIATQDYTNCLAKGTIKVDDKIILKDVPVTYLLFLEKHLTNVHTFVNKLPVLEAADNWEWDKNNNQYKSEEFRTNKTKKTYFNHVKAEATKEHPAQVEVYPDDIKIGEWTTTKFSGAIPWSEKQALLNKVAKLVDGVKMAREEANLTEVREQSVGKEIFDYLFATPTVK